MQDKDAYVKKLHARIAEWNAEIDRLKARADRAKSETRVEYQREVKSLQERRKEAEKKLADVRAAGADAWQDLKSGVQSAWESMEDAIKSARSRFK